MNWHWELCPTCGARGWLTVRQMGGTGLTETVETFSCQCDSCDGVGRVKIPNGWHLQGDAVGGVTISSATVTIKPSFTPSDTHSKAGLA
mgnify:CR=1 FL=1